MRLIDADVLINSLLIDPIACMGCPEPEFMQELSDILDTAPTFDLIRCKECKHWYSDADCGMACEFTNMGQPEDGYCNWAER